MDAAFLQNHYPKHEQQGIFPQVPSLKDFLRSDPAVAATLRKLWGFLPTRSFEACQKTIEVYVVRGGDGGLTRRSLRFCCGLSEEIVEATPREHSGVLSAKTTTFLDPVPSESGKLESQSTALIAYLLAEGREHLSAE